MKKTIIYAIVNLLFLVKVTAQDPLISGTVKQGATPVANATINLIMPWTDSAHPYVNLTATTNAQGEYSFSNADLDGYKTINSLKLNSGNNGGVTYYPTDIANIPMPTSPKTFDFNSQEVKPAITINNPNNALTSIDYGTALALNATVKLSFDNGSDNISSVVFKVNGTTVTTSNAGNDVYTGSWSPTDADYGVEHTFSVVAEASNGSTLTKDFKFTLGCNGSGCPNLKPSIVWNKPASTTLNQNDGFKNIPIEVTVTDIDGTIASAQITINGNSNNMTATGGNKYTYNFTPTNHQEYPVTITATDNEGASTTYTTKLNIINSVFTPLPSGNIILGYAHSWENAGAPFLYFRDMADKNYNVVMYSFIETEGQNGHTPKLTINSARYQSNGAFDKQLLKDDIQFLRDKGIPVIASIGGQNGHVELGTTAHKDEFVAGLKAIIDEYGFDGLDLDFEGGSMDFGAGALKDFSYENLAPFPKLKNVVDAFKEIKQHYGEHFILTCAPETFYVQVGYATYNNRGGSFLPVIHNLREELDLVMVQLYNTGSINALDDIAYAQATPDFIVAMTDMLLTGFKVASTGFHFPALPATKVMVGLPSCPSAAPAGGYLRPSETIKALNYLRFGTEYGGRKYTLRGNPHANIRGMMTWSVNWDAAASCASSYEYSTAYSNYFNDNGTLSSEEVSLLQEFNIYPNPTQDVLNFSGNKTIDKLQIFDSKGAEVFSQKGILNKQLDVNFLQSGVYFLNIESNKKRAYKKIIKK
ncbi:T9SS type A sorting domain-containing protein [Tenacibaculum sp. 190524A02b]|uniref:T9SS type A sorting domain-containing protein n=1 Tax=Tenacibaculum vairaonense TaxID=3137860 RepID=UPI0031FA70DA